MNFLANSNTCTFLATGSYQCPRKNAERFQNAQNGCEIWATFMKPNWKPDRYTHTRIQEGRVYLKTEWETGRNKELGIPTPGGWESVRFHLRCANVSMGDCRPQARFFKNGNLVEDWMVIGSIDKKTFHRIGLFDQVQFRIKCGPDDVPVPPPPKVITAAPVAPPPPPPAQAPAKICHVRKLPPGMSITQCNDACKKQFGTLKQHELIRGNENICACRVDGNNACWSPLSIRYSEPVDIFSFNYNYNISQ